MDAETILREKLAEMRAKDAEEDAAFVPFTAERLNGHLSKGGMVQITTYAKSTMYDSRHAGWFSEGKDGFLYLRHGRGRVCLGKPSRPMIGIRMSRLP